MATTAQEVKDITGSTLADAVIQPFIDAAECLIDAAAECTTATDACQDMAHTYLSAHLLVTSNVGKASAQVKREKLEDVYEATYSSNGGSGTDVLSTTFGETANMLMGGCLKELGKTPVDIISIGTIGC